MTDLATNPDAAVADLPGGPYDIEFFFDPGCPFAWQTSQWVRRVMELKGITVGWRFISLKFINEDKDEWYPGAREAQHRGLRYHRICAAAREQFGNEAVNDLYRAWGEAYWNTVAEGDLPEKFEAAIVARAERAAREGVPELRVVSAIREGGAVGATRGVCRVIP